MGKPIRAVTITEVRGGWLLSMNDGTPMEYDVKLPVIMKKARAYLMEDREVKPFLG